MVTNVEVMRNGTENSMGVMRRFTQKMRAAGIVNKMKKVRFRTRAKSKMTIRKQALRKLERRDEFEKLIRDGKIPESMRGRRIRRK